MAERNSMQSMLVDAQKEGAQITRDLAEAKAEITRLTAELTNKSL